jgi:hypothetical protein
MVDGITSTSIQAVTSTVNKQRPAADSTSSKDSSNKADEAVVVNVSEEAKAKSTGIEAEVARSNQAASGAEAPTTQELASALNADTVAVALGNTVNISV